jgi:hypothetical protein
MRRRMLITAAAVTLVSLSVVSPPAKAFSDWIGVYAIIDKVVVEPSAGAPERIRLWGDFSVATSADRNNYDPPQRGYLYFTIKPGKEEATRKEWNDLKALAGTGQVVGLGLRSQLNFKVRKNEDKPASPDEYPIGSGLVRMSDRSSSYGPFVALKALPRPKGNK